MLDIIIPLRILHYTSVWAGHIGKVVMSVLIWATFLASGLGFLLMLFSAIVYLVKGREV